MITRDLEGRLREAAESFPAVTLTGPRQSGKSTLCQALFSDHPHANLEAPDVRAFAIDDPRGFLAQFPRGAIIDEVQRCPDLLSYLQGIVDDDPAPGRWILTGSQNLALLESVSQSLAGRTAVLNLLPLTRREVKRFDNAPTDLEEAMFAGGYPAIFDRQVPPAEWLTFYVQTYIERDVRTITNVGDLVTFQRFVELCAGRTAQMMNYSSLASDCGISQPTAKAWLSVLETSFLVFRLPAFHGNVRKRLVKMPKLHFYDTGLVCWLLGIRDAEQLRTHPLRGEIFETWVVSEILKHRLNAGERHGASYYRDQRGVEADMVIDHPDQLLVVEAKAGRTITNDMLRSLRRAQETLASVRNVDPNLVYGGDQTQRRTGVTVASWDTLDTIAWR